MHTTATRVKYYVYYARKGTWFWDECASYEAAKAVFDVRCQQNNYMFVELYRSVDGKRRLLDWE